MTSDDAERDVNEEGWFKGMAWGVARQGGIAQEEWELGWSVEEKESQETNFS